MEDFLKLYENCMLCPRKCGVDRRVIRGFCGCTDKLMVSRAALHFWEEPCISGTNGSGTVFFSGCNLHCVFCQNHEISGNEYCGKEITIERLSEIYLELQAKGANNINLVTATHFIPSVIMSIQMAKANGLTIPIVYNSSGYETEESIRLLEGFVDIYLPDMKYMDTALSKRYSNAIDYPQNALTAIDEMVRQVNSCCFDEVSGLMKKGVIVRHLVLPGQTKNSMEVIRSIYERYKDKVFVSIMNQYTPFSDILPQSEEYSNLFRRVTKREYEKVISYALNLGIKNGFTQEGKTAESSFTPTFKNCEGV